MFRQMFHFRHLPISSEQDISKINGYISELSKFCEEVSSSSILPDENDFSISHFSTSELNSLKKSLRLMKTDLKTSREGVDWYPKYSAAICGYYNELRPGYTSLVVIGLDGWKIKPQLKKADVEYTADATDQLEFQIGLIPTERLTEYFQLVKSALETVSKRIGAQRSAAGGRQGHQHTAAFLNCAARQAIIQLEEGDAMPVPYGGTTDVGLHCGGKERSTCWSLVCRVWKSTLQNNQLYEKSIVNFELKLLESIMEVEISGLFEIDECLTIVDSISHRIIKFLDKKIDVSQLVDRLNVVFVKLKTDACCKNASFAKLFTLSQFERPDFTFIDCTTLGKNASDGRLFKSCSITNEQALKELSHHISIHPTSDARFGDLLRWLKDLKSSGSGASTILFILHEIEQFMYEASKMLTRELPLEREMEMESFVEVINLYKATMNEWLLLKESSILYRTMWKSKELIVLWIGACLVHQRVCNINPQTKRYAIPLDCGYLSSVTSDDKLQCDALLNVDRYIRTCNENASENLLFSITKPSGSFEFAREFARTNTQIQNRLKFEQQQVSDRENRYLNQVLEQKRSVDQLQSEVPVLESRVRKRQHELDQMICEDSWGDYHYRRRQAEQNVTIAKRELEQVRQQIKQMQIPPNSIINPLPEIEASGETLIVLFFLLMPREYVVLCSSIIEAQRAMVPPNEDIQHQTRDCFDWILHYNSYSDSKIYVNDERLILIAKGLKIPNAKDIRLSSIDFITHGSQGMWFPHQYVNGLRTKGADNPFQISLEKVEKYFTEINMDEKLLWSISYPPSSKKSSRSKNGNLPYSLLNLKPNAIEKDEYLALTTVRSFPNQQIRKIISALNDHNLPANVDLVSSVLRVALYQLGPRSELNKLDWKFDFDFDAYESLTNELKNCADDIRHTPRNHRKLPLLCEISGYLSQYYAPAREVSRMFKEIAVNWYTEAEKEMETSSFGPEEMLNFRAKQCLIVGYAVLGMSAYGEFTAEDAEELVGLLVRFRNNLVYAVDSALASEFEKVLHAVNYIMSHRIKLLLEKIELDPRSLTSAFRQVHKRFPNSIETGKTWTREGNSTAFVFKYKADEVYWVDVYSGDVLINGSPPHRLPHRIRSTAVFKKCFGDRDFDVVRTEGGYATSVPLQKCFFYEFEEIQNEGLRIREIKIEKDESSEWDLIDLDSPKGEMRWPKLPIILKVNFSVWHCQKSGVFVFRKHFFTDRNIFFICDGVKCYEVPLALRLLEFHEIVAKLETLAYLVVENNSKTLCVLEKFELRQFIHSLYSPSEGENGTFFYDLPRLQLRFYIKDGRLVCREIVGFALASEQQLSDTFPYFKRYLVLERLDSDNISLPRRKIIMPDGEVDQDFLNSKSVTITTSDTPDAKIRYFVYDEHEHLQSFISQSILSRLHLATILSATGSMLIDERFRMTGSEAALIELRKCWVNRPLTKEEAEKLKNLAKVSFREPSIEVVVNQFFIETQNLDFLFSKSGENHVPVHGNERVNLSVNELRSRIESRIPNNLYRQGLLQEEQILEMGIEFSNPQLYNCFNSLANKVELRGKPPIIDKNYVGLVEKKLGKILSTTKKSIDGKFPLEAKYTSSKLANEVIKELRQSWEHHQAEDSYSIKSLDWAEIENLIVEVETHVGKMNTFLETSICGSLETDTDNNLATISKLLEFTNRVPTMTFFDRLKISCDKNVALSFNLFLSKNAVNMYHESVLNYLELVVLLDKLKRIRRYRDSSRYNEAMLIKELQCARNWSVNQYPHWLVFEAEGCLQIRPEQYTIVEHLLKFPGSISQLNMGLGKTRVILPMLIIQYSRTSAINGNPRVTMLSSLIREGSEYLHQRLTASALALRLFELPFHRDVFLTNLRIKVIEQYAKRKSSFLVVAPEHRCSLDLKKMELQESNHETYSALANYLKYVKFADIIDESDAVLSYKYQLVYAIGERHALKNCDERTMSAQALLRIINNPGEELREELQSLTIYSEKPTAAEFKDVRIIRKLTEDESHRLREKLIRSLLGNLPEEFRALRLWCEQHGDLVPSLISFVTDSKVAGDNLISQMKCEAQIAQILALRGFLAFGLLEHALQQRNKIDYGVDPNRKPKQMSIPYRAADVPSERSEYSHPDVGIVLTIVGYYYDGLTEAQLMEAFKMLLSQGPPAQKRYYGEWLRSISCDARQREMIGKVENIDLTNQVQFDLLFEKYRKSTEVINFWLNSTVFQTDTIQYEKRILATSWNLTDGNLVVGFSGTKDEYRLLPLHVTQKEPNVSSLLATNGRMLEYIIKSTISCQVLDPLKEKKPMWKVVLEHAVSENFHALIDTGGQLAGVSNKKAAEYLLSQSHLDPTFRGVCYFDPTSEHQVRGCWIILDRVNRLHQPKADSSIHERECFVLFDDARSRGADMKLLSNAIAGITLGQRMNKDKLMQGAGRLRQLGEGQRLVILIPKELENAIQIGFTGDAVNKTKQVLQWVMENTILSTTNGLGQWASQGLYHALTNRHQDASALDEDWTLDTLYKGTLKQKSLKDTVNDRISRQTYRRLEFVERIASQCANFGDDLSVFQSDHLQECEKELQLEQEDEEEIEVEWKAQNPITETGWEYSKIINTTTPTELKSEVEIIHLSDAINDKLSPESLKCVAWEKSKVYVTNNFLRTVVGSKVEQDYSRVANAALIYCENGVYKATLLLSDMEADGVLGEMWKSFENSIPVFGYVKFLRNAKDGGYPGSKAHLNIGRSGVDWDIPEIDLAAIQLWNGETMFETQGRKDAVRELISNQDCEIALRELVYARGLRRNWASSDLEKMVVTV